MEKKAITPEQRELYLKLLSTHTEIEPKGKNIPYTSYNGNMHTVFSSNGKLGIRLAKTDREAFIAKYNSSLLESNGTTMKEYVTVPDDLLEQTEELKPYLTLSFEYVKSLKPKPTKKKK